MKRCRANSVRAETKKLLLEYCSNSSVHGVRYFGCSERTWCEKIWWIIVFVLSIVSCTFLINKIYRKWDETPVIVSFAEKTTPVWQIPFPAVTICSQTKVQSRHLNFAHDFEQHYEFFKQGYSDVNVTSNYLAMFQLCEVSFFSTFLRPFYLPNKTSPHSYGTLIRNMSIPMFDSITFCTIHSTRVPCALMYSTSMTEEGICATFNSLAADDLLRTEIIQQEDPYLSEDHESPYWTLEQGYSPKANLDSYPHRSVGAGYAAGISLILQIEDENLEYICSGPVQGFKILLHSPADYPQISKKFVHVPMNQDVTIAVKPQMTTTTRSLESYTPERRQCFFNHERYLQFFRVYTQDNCELECLTNYTLQYCGCVRFSMPRTNLTAVCESNQISCMLNAEKQLLEMDVVKDKNNQTKNFRANCNCLVACTSTQYDAEITQTDFNWINWLKAFKIPTNETVGYQIARLSIYFKEAQFMTAKRSELYGLTDFLANCGGLLGLCMGVSLLSLVELFYFCSIRPFMLWRKPKPRRRQLADTLPTIKLLSIATKRD
ncbi:pickpocket protein 28-like [Wyeomyia smithii]|uniref:pickpocket protein 28-like n=1 Tax=Wyeomyia smithii TaxID=174621 RepID=UPI002467CA2A|nr:pickpocket protein 28-like [Wyeomyia smithii]